MGARRHAPHLPHGFVACDEGCTSHSALSIEPLCHSADQPIRLPCAWDCGCWKGISKLPASSVVVAMERQQALILCGLATPDVAPAAGAEALVREGEDAQLVEWKRRLSQDDWDLVAALDLSGGQIDPDIDRRLQVLIPPLLLRILYRQLSPEWPVVHSLFQLIEHWQSRGQSDVGLLMLASRSGATFSGRSPCRSSRCARAWATLAMSGSQMATTLSTAWGTGWLRRGSGGNA